MVKWWNGEMVKRNCKREWENVIRRTKWIGSAARTIERNVSVWQGKAAAACLKCAHCCCCAGNFMAIIKANDHNGLHELHPTSYRRPHALLTVCPVCVCASCESAYETHLNHTTRRKFNVLLISFCMQRKEVGHRCKLLSGKW